MKIFEAMGNGLPVVASPEGAEGIDAVHGEHWFLAENPEAFADSTCRLLSDGGLRDHMGDQAREWVENHHNWDRSVERLEAVYERLLA